MWSFHKGIRVGGCGDLEDMHTLADDAGAVDIDSKRTSANVFR